ncbi:MAG: endonuclease/exonuclease/phosphatase family protein [Bacteroidales bacterium]
MKKILTVLAVCTLSCFCGFAQNKKVAVYGVGFYNLENLFDTINNNGKYDLEFSPEGARRWNGQKYWSKQKNMAYTIAQMGKETLPNGLAVLGVSEIENRSVLEDLVKTGELANRNLKIVHYDSPDKRGVDVGLLYDPKSFRVLASQSRRLYMPEKPDFLTRDQLVVTGLLAGEKISFVVNHWPSRLGGESQSSPLREAAAALTKSIVDSLMQLDPKAGVIVMGDLNDDPINKSCKDVLRAKKKEKEVAEGDMFNTMWQIYDKGIGTLAYKGQWNLFDQIIITPNLLGKERSNLKFWKAEVFNKPFLMNEDGLYKGYPKRTHAAGVFLNGYSDHFPTLIYLAKEVK